MFGHEHYAENLEDLACAGVPIHHPVTGRLVGAVDLTCWRKDAGSLLLTLAKTTADQIRQALLTDASASQMELFQEYLRTCSRTSGIVFALNSDVVMLNDQARATLTPGDQSTLLAQAMEAKLTRRGTVLVELPSGLGARMHCRRVGGGDHPSGVVAHVVLDPIGHGATHAATPLVRMPLPSLVGSGPPWLHACQEVETIFRSGEWLAVEGEPGVGKLAVLRAVQLRRQPVARFEVLEARDAATDERLAAVRAQHALECRERGDPSRRRARAPPCSGASPRRSRKPGQRVRRRCGSRSRWAPRSTARACRSCCSCSRAASRCHRCACTSRTCRSWCRSSCRDSARADTWSAPPRRCGC